MEHSNDYINVMPHNTVILKMTVSVLQKIKERSTTYCTPLKQLREEMISLTVLARIMTPKLINLK